MPRSKRPGTRVTLSDQEGALVISALGLLLSAQESDIQERMKRHDDPATVHELAEGIDQWRQIHTLIDRLAELRGVDQADPATPDAQT